VTSDARPGTGVRNEPGGATPRILVVALATREAPVLPRELGDAEVLVVSPASNLSRLKWLANEEDKARAQAEETARQTAESLPGESAATEVGDVDPLQAVEDALREFEADEIVVLVPPEDEASWLERGSVESGFEQFGRPVRYLVAER
jgi:hypothetical protein